VNERSCDDETVGGIGGKISEIDGADGDFTGERELDCAVVKVARS
jgi:hypothetical protein